MKKFFVITVVTLAAASSIFAQRTIIKRSEPRVLLSRSDANDERIIPDTVKINDKFIVTGYMLEAPVHTDDTINGQLIAPSSRIDVMVYTSKGETVNGPEFVKVKLLTKRWQSFINGNGHWKWNTNDKSYHYYYTRVFTLPVTMAVVIKDAYQYGDQSDPASYEVRFTANM
jgi:hypothetical protein